MKKRFFAQFLIFCLFFALCACIPVSADTWNGTRAKGFAGGSGTSTDPYRIETAEQLAFLAKDVKDGNQYRGKYLQLSADIVLNDPGAAIPNEWTPIGDPSHLFMGNFDGNGKTISGLYIKKKMSASAESYGLFGNVKRAKISNLILDDVYLDITTASTSTTTSLYVGALCGYVDNSEIRNVRVTAEIVVTRDQNTFVGGLVGRSEEVSTISFVETNGSVLVNTTKVNTSNSTVGGVVGRLSGLSKISGAINNCTVTGGGDVGGLAGIAGGGEMPAYIENAINTAAIKGDLYVGGLIGRAGHVSEGYAQDCLNAGQVSKTDTFEDAAFIGTLCGVVKEVFYLTNCKYVVFDAEQPLYSVFTEGTDNGVKENISPISLEDAKGNDALQNLGFSDEIWRATEDGFPVFNPEALLNKTEEETTSLPETGDPDTSDQEPQTNAPKTQESVTTSPRATGTTADPKTTDREKGCASVLGANLAVMILLTGCAGMLLHRKKD